MEANGPLKALFTALCLAGALGCSSDPPPADAGTDAGVADNGVTDDIVVFSGRGNLSVNWTVDGMPAAVGCAAVGAAFVDVQATFGNPVRVPCAQGTFAATDLDVGPVGVGTTLLRADGTAIYCYTVNVMVERDRTVEGSVDFVRPGTLSVRWTVNGNAPRPECSTTTATLVQVEVRGQTAQATSCAGGVLTFTGRTAPNATCRPMNQGIQPGRYEVTGSIYSGTSSNPRLIQRVMAEAEVPSGSAGAGEVVLDFTAPPRPVDE
jgi:hypothetical protein